MLNTEIDDNSIHSFIIYYKKDVNKYYLNHLKALEQQRQEEIEMTEQVKVKIMQQAAIMQYDDDFDEE